MNESLVKYLAGLLDADGSLSFNFRDTGYRGNRTGRYTMSLRLTLAAADTIDKGGFVASLAEQTGMGTVSRHRNLSWWRVGKRSELEMLLPRLIKHMVIKAKHWQWLLDVWRIYRKEISEPCDENGCARLRAASKASRKDVGPIKPKNHPTWAWLAGYLDGDGTYHFRKRRRKDGTEQCVISVSACAHVDDAFVLIFLQKAFGGNICNQMPDGRLKLWQRSLGKRNSSFALAFLPKVVRHARLKRHRIEVILNHTRQQRLSVSKTTV